MAPFRQLQVVTVPTILSHLVALTAITVRADWS